MLSPSFTSLSLFPLGGYRKALKKLGLLVCRRLPKAPSGLNPPERLPVALVALQRCHILPAFSDIVFFVFFVQCYF
jgi:hypothetical protein